MKSWAEVTQSAEYHALTPEQREAARQQYFADVVSPRVPESDRLRVREQFDAETGPRRDTPAAPARGATESWGGPGRGATADFQQRFDPKVGTGEYVWNEVKKVPGALLGLAPDVLEAIGNRLPEPYRPSGGTGRPFGANTRAFQEAMGAKPDMLPPTRGAEMAGVVAQNVAAAVPFAGAAMKARGVLGAGTELLSGLTAGGAQAVARETTSGNPWAEIAASLFGGYAGFRAGNAIEKTVPLVKAGVSAMKGREDIINTALKAKGLVEGSPEFKQAYDAAMEVGKREAIDELRKAYAQEDMGAISKVLDEYQTIKRKFPGFSASVGEITGNESALSLQGRLESKNIGTLSERGSRIRANQAAINEARERLVPTQPGAARAAVKGVQRNVDDETARLAAREAELTGEAQQVAGRVEAQAAPIYEAGQDLKAASQSDYLKSRSKADELYKTFRAKIPQGLETDSTDLLDKVKEIRTTFTFDQQPRIFDVLESVGAPTKAEDLAKQAAKRYEGQTLTETIKRLGGVRLSERLDIAGDTRNLPVGLFKASGQGLDELATKLRTEHQFLIPDDQVDGGVQALRDMLAQELRKEAKHYPAPIMDDIARTEQAQKFMLQGGKEKPGTVSALQLDDLARAANHDIQREMSKPNPDRKLISQLTQIREEVQAKLYSTLEEAGATDAFGAYQAANRYFKETHAPKYLTGINLKMRLRDALGEQRIKPEDLVGKFFSPKGVTEAKRFNTQFADNGPAKENLARGVLDLYKREVIDKGGGIIGPHHDFFMRKYASVLDEYPWIKARLEKNTVGVELSRRMEETRAAAGEIAESRIVKALGGRDVESFIGQAVKDRNFMAESMSRMNRDDRRNLAVAVLNRGWDEAEGGSAAVSRFLEDEKNLRVLFRLGFGGKEGADHLHNLKLLARALKINESAPKTSPMTALAEDSLKEKTGASWVMVMSALRSIGRRPGSGDWFVAVFGGMFARAKIKAQQDAILKQQLFDPDLLKATLEEARSKGLPGIGPVAGSVTDRAKVLASKLWDLTKAAAGEGAGDATLRRLPGAAVAAEQPEYAMGQE